MSKNDYVLDIINELNRRNGMPDDGFFPSLKDRAYRLEAIRLMFCGLERENLLQQKSKIQTAETY